MRTIVYSTIAVVGLCVGLNFFSLNYWQKEPLPNFGKIKEFSFTNAKNEDYSSLNLAGKVWVFNLFFTSCEGPCPLITANLKNVYRDFSDHSDFKMISLSVDPERDTPVMLEKYAARFEFDLTKWVLLVGSEQKMREAALESFKLGTNDDAKIHSNRLVLIDRQGEIRGYYVGIVPDDIEKLKSDIKQLL